MRVVSEPLSLIGSRYITVGKTQHTIAFTATLVWSDSIVVRREYMNGIQQNLAILVLLIGIGIDTA